MKTRLFAAIVLMALLMHAASAAISSEEAVSFLSSNGYLKQNESPEIDPLAKITNAQNQYWVVTILSGDTPTGFVAVQDAIPTTVPTSASINQPLFRTAFVLRGFQQSKASLGSQWLFIASNDSFFQNLSQSFQREFENDLGIIESSTNDVRIKAQTTSMKTRIQSLKQQSDALSQSINDSIASENRYFLSPDTEGIAGFQNGFLDTFDQLDRLQEGIQSYDSEKTKLKSLIAQSNAASDEKSFWVNLADPPSDMYSVKSKQSTAANNRQVLENIFETAPIQAVTFTENLDNRLKMVETKNALYSEDATIKDLAGKAISLKAAVEQILAEQNAPQWKNQVEVQNLESFWKKALEQFNNANYESALSNANKAKTSARKVYSAGIQEQTPATPEFEQYIPTAIGVLVFALVVLFLIQKRKKIVSMVTGEQSGLQEPENNFRI